MSNLIYSSESWTISLNKKKILEATLLNVENIIDRTELECSKNINYIDTVDDNKNVITEIMRKERCNTHTIHWNQEK